MSALTRLWLASAAAAALFSSSIHARAASSCGDATVDAPDEVCDDGNRDAGDGCSPECAIECLEVNTPLTEHTCQHGSLGPFETRASLPYPGPAQQGDFQTHVYYDIVLSGEPSENRSVIAFGPHVTSPYALYLKEEYPLRVLDEAGVEQLPVLEHAISSCAVRDSLTWVRVYPRFEAGALYTIDIGPWPELTVSLVFEQVESRTVFFRDGDGDDFGVAEGKVTTWCGKPTTGHAARSGDCDDSSELAHPGATEVCDGQDNDCDRSVDEGGSSLCQDAATGPACLSAGDTAFCGCSSSADCLAGETCDDDTRTCGATGGGEGQAGSAGADAGADAGMGGAAPDAAGRGGTTGTGPVGGPPGGSGAFEAGGGPVADAGAGASESSAGSSETPSGESPADGRDSGCGCHAVGSRDLRAVDAWLTLGLLLALTRVRRRQACRHSSSFESSPS